METKHIKLNYEEAISAKKELLNSEVNILNILRKFKNYKILRKKENATRNKTKSNLISLRTKTKHIQSSFPAEETKEIEKTSKENKKEKIEHKQISEELADIKEKLERLG